MAEINISQDWFGNCEPMGDGALDLSKDDRKDGKGAAENEPERRRFATISLVVAMLLLSALIGALLYTSPTIP